MQAAVANVLRPDENGVVALKIRLLVEGEEQLALLMLLSVFVETSVVPTLIDFEPTACSASSAIKVPSVKIPLVFGFEARAPAIACMTNCLLVFCAVGMTIVLPVPPAFLSAFM